MPAGVSNPEATPEVKETLEKIEKSCRAFTIVHKNGQTMSLPLLHMNNLKSEKLRNNKENDSGMEEERSIKNDRASTGGYCASNKNNNCKRMCRSNEHLLMANLQNHRANPLRITRNNNKEWEKSKSEEGLAGSTEKRRNGAPENKTIVVGENNATRQTAIALSTEDFNEVLNAKLRNMEQRESEKNRRELKKSPESSKKPFITTVKSGEFLKPPPEVAALLGMSPNGSWIGPLADRNNVNEENEASTRSRFRRLVSLGNRPQVRHNSHNARCPAALRATLHFPSNLYNLTAPNNKFVNSNSCNIFNNNNDDLGNIDNMNSTMNLSCSNADQIRRTNRFFNTRIGLKKTRRAYLRKLEPIEGMMNMLPSLGDQPLPFGNIMFDRRVVRGSTFASAPMLIDPDESQAMRQAEAKRKQIAKKRAQSQAARLMMMRIGTPPPVPGRKHEPVQTELYLEELYDKPEETEVATQTDYFLDKPPTPTYCAGKTGQDAETQIGPGDLFDYDAEVQPILEVLVGKTIEQALIEVLEEEELAALREQQRRFRELRAAEKAEQQRLEQQERRLREEKYRRVRQHEEAVKTQKETEERVAAAVLLTGYIAELLPAVLEGLKMSGFLLDEIKADTEEGFMPWLMKEVKKEMGSVIESRELLMEIIREILENRAQTYARLGEEYDKTRESGKSEEKEKSPSEVEIPMPTDEGDESHEADFDDEYQPPDQSDETNFQ